MRASQERPKIRALFFDWGNVLGLFDHLKTAAALAETTTPRRMPEEVYERIFGGKLETAFDCGTISSYDFYAAVRRAVGLAGVPFKEFVARWSASLAENNAIEEVLLRIALPLGRLFIISNTNELHWLAFKEFPLMRLYFGNERRHVLSFREGVKKPDERIFRAALRRAHCRAESAVFIDDMPANVAAFKAIGGNGIVYNARIDSPGSLIAALKPYGVLDQRSAP